MANISRWDPFRIEPFEDPFDSLFRGFMVRPFGADFDKQVQQVKVDVKEDAKAYTVHAEIPGVKKEDIHVSVDGNRVMLSAEVRKESEQKQGETVIRSERYFGKIYRAFNLENEVDEGAARAKYSDGVLELTLPKKAVVEARRIAIE